MGYNVLIVDDSAAMRSIIGKTLRLSGLAIDEVFQASNGQEALEVLENNWIDLALVDINMPVMDGETMISHVRDNPDTDKLPIIVVSTESSETRIGELRKMDVVFIHKPFAPEDLKESICTITGVKPNAGINSNSSSLDF